MGEARLRRLPPRPQRDIGRAPQLAPQPVGIAGRVRIAKQHLQRPADRADERSHQRRRADLYFDSVSRVRLPTWSQGRIALLGDAASCLSLFGNGSSLAITGAATLARSLAATPEDHATAFRAYEAEHRVRIRPTQRGRLIAGALLVPATRPGIAARNLAVRLLRR